MQIDFKMRVAFVTSNIKYVYDKGGIRNIGKWFNHLTSVSQRVRENVKCFFVCWRQWENKWF